MAASTKLRTWVFRIFTVVGALTCGTLALSCITFAMRCGEQAVPARTVLEIDLERPLEESVPSDPIAQVLGRKPTTVRDVVEALEKARGDDRVVGLVAWVGEVDHGMARTQELRDAIVRFRESGKFAIAYAETFGELGPGNQGYYLATAFDEVWLQPTGGIGLTGIASSSPFVKGTLDMLEIQPRGDHRREYKNALNLFTERAFTPAHREASQALVDDMFGQLVAGIAERRGLGEDEVRALVDRGPFLAPEALEARLVDGLAYRDEVIAKVKERAGAAAELLYLAKYRERAGSPWEGEKTIALVHGVGAITRGDSSSDPVLGSQSMGSATVAAALRAAIEDEDVVAIVFRVDSGGGSAVASDTIWREVVRAKAAGKPVIVSMGNVAGSGGYYVACAANKIVAQPATITGSIGVVGGKPVVRNAWAKIGVTFDGVQSSKNGTMFSDLHDYDAEEWARLQAWLDWVYADFKRKVGEGRGLSDEAVETVAKGRIWSGERAKSLGLVDELGGLTTALALARSEAGLADDEPIAIEVFPRPKEWWQRFVEDGPDSSEDPAAVQVELASGLERWRKIAQRLAQVGVVADEDGVLVTTPIEIAP